MNAKTELFFEDFVTVPEEGFMPKCLGVRLVEGNAENRPLGSLGRRKMKITQPITLQKGVNQKIYKASFAKPIHVVTTLNKLN